MGDANASIPTPQPQLPRPMFGAFGAMPARLGLHFVSPAALEAGLADRWQSERRLVPVKDVSRPVQGQPAGERRAARDRRGQRDVRGARRRRAHRAAARRRTAHGPALLPVLSPMNALLLLLLDSRAPAGAHHHSGGMEAAVGTGLVAQPGQPGGLLPGQAPDVGPGRGRVRRRGVPASIRFVPNELRAASPPSCPPTSGPRSARSGPCSTPSSRRGRPPRRRARRRVSSAAGCCACSVRSCPRRIW